jgi:hypothetical protein
MTPDKVSRPFRAGVFATVDAADRAVTGLQEAGFTTEEISVVCSDEARRELFGEFQHERPSGSSTPRRAAAGGVAGTAVGALLAAATVVATGGLSLLVVGPIVGTGAVFGTFVGAMTSRGVENELADYYDQAVRRGKLLVAAEPDASRDDHAARLATAERVLEAAGAEPVALPEG